MSGEPNTPKQRTYRVLRAWRPASMPVEVRQAADEEWLNRYGDDGYRLIRAEAVGDVMVYVMELVA